MYSHIGISETLPLATLALLQKLDVVAPGLPYILKYDGDHATLLDRDGQPFASIYRTVGEDGHPIPGSTRHTWAINLEE